MPMTQEEQYYHNLLSSIYPCKVPFTICVKNDKPKTRLGTYWPSRKHILIHTGRRDKYDPVETAIHEYAHHIHYTEFDKEKKEADPARKGVLADIWPIDEPCERNGTLQAGAWSSANLSETRQQSVAQGLGQWIFK